MGISGLLTLLKSIQQPCNLKKYNGMTLGIDAYGWLHRGAVACAIDLALEKPTRRYVEYTMHRVRMLIHFGIKPYLVFDGDYLPSKAATENGRAKRREESKKTGLEFMKMGRQSQAHLEFQKAVDVTPEMARDLIEELKQSGIDYIVAPYEADAQLFYLEKKGIIHGVISEDSDLLVFGVKRLITKLDQYGDCIEINRKDFTACRDVSLVGWSDADFRRMAILSGCDYLDNINKMGLKTAYRLVRKHKDIDKILRMLQFDGRYSVPLGYREGFKRAEMTFLHQRVFCPIQQKLVMTSNLQGQEPADFDFIGKDVDASIAVGVAIGDLDPMTKLRLSPSAKALPYNLESKCLRRSQTDVCLKSKSTKPIDSFFGPRREPLAELDPNRFSLSASQFQLLQRQNQTVNSSLVRHLPTLQPSTPPGPISRPSTNSSTGTTSATVCRKPMKRARLCEELDETATSDTRVSKLGLQSRYFSGNGKGKIKNGNTKQENEFVVQLFSDDSLDQAIACLSEDQIISGTQKPEFKVFRDDLDDNHALKASLLQKKSAHKVHPQSQPAQCSQASSDKGTVLVSYPDLSQYLRTDEFTAISAEGTHKAGETRPKSSRGATISRCEAASKPINRSLGTTHTNSLQPLREPPMTPLQRMGRNALRGSQSTKSKDSRVLTTKPSKSVEVKAKASICGSEDLLNAEQDEEMIDRRSEYEIGPSRKLDLERFRLR